jgi:FkbM family methyltransferase
MRRLIRSAARFAYQARGYHPTTIGRERFQTDPYHIGFWRDVSRGRWEPGTFRFLERSLRPDSIFLDVGAWIGPTTLYAARRCRRVYCFEPDPEAYRHLLWNLSRNRASNVVCFEAALARTSGMRRLWGHEGALGTSHSSLLAPERERLPNEQPGRVETAFAPTQVRTIGWDDWMREKRPGRIDCIKMDIQGGEFELLPAMRDYLAAERPALHVSVHGYLLPEEERHARVAEVLDLLRVYPVWRSESEEPVTPDAALSAASHEYVLVLERSA